MIRELAPADPLMPEVAGPRQPLVGVRKRLRRGRVAPREGAEHLVPRPQTSTGDRPGTLETEVEVRGQPDNGLIVARGHLGLAIPVGKVPPLAAASAVIKGRLTLQQNVERATQTPHRAQEHLL